MFYRVVVCIAFTNVSVYSIGKNNFFVFVTACFSSHGKTVFTQYNICNNKFNKVAFVSICKGTGELNIYAVTAGNLVTGLCTGVAHCADVVTCSIVSVDVDSLNFIGIKLVLGGVAVLVCVRSIDTA